MEQPIAGPRKRAVWTHTAWTAAEDDVFLRAWEEVVRQPPCRNVIKALSARFEETRGAGPVRTESALAQRRSGYLRMHDIITSFHARAAQQQQQQTETDWLAYSTDDFFALSHPEQRRWVSSADVPGTKCVHLDRATFERVSAIMGYTGDHTPSHQSHASAPERKRLAEQQPSVAVSTGKKARARGNGHQRHGGSATASFDIVIAADDADASGSSTESDDDLVRTRSVDSDDSDGGNGGEREGLLTARVHSRLQQPQNRKPVTSSDTKRPGSNSSSTRLKPQTSDTTSSPGSAAVPLNDSSAESDLASLMELLSDQTRLLKAMFKQTQQEREHDNHERQRTVLRMHQSHERVLDEVRRCERVLTRQSHECERERVDAQRDLARLQSLQGERRRAGQL